MSRPWIGFDLDGTLAEYGVWEGPDKIGPPIQPMLDKLKELLSQGNLVKILTARVCSMQTPEDIALATKTIQDWCELHTGKRLEVTSEKDWFLIEFYDDRCIPVEFNTGRIMLVKDTAYLDPNI